MPLPLWTERLLKLPGVKHFKSHMLKSGHTEEESNAGALAAGGLALFLAIIIFNTFIFGVIRGSFQNIWNYCQKNQNEAIGVAIFGTMMLLALLFQLLRSMSLKTAEKERGIRNIRHKIEEKRDYLKRGAMGNVEEILRFYLSEKYPEIEIKSVHMVDMIPRVRFMVRRFNTELGGEVDKNYELFRDTLFADTLHVLEVVFFLSENINVAIVDGMMNFISGKAKYYDGHVLSVKAQRDVFEHTREKKLAPFKVLTSFDLRYNDGMEVKPMPEEESKTAKVIERLMENAPRINVRYESAKTKVEDGWEKPKVMEEPEVIQETLRGKEFSSMPLAEFQDLVLRVLAKMSFEVQKVKKVPGGTLQIQADFSHPVVGGSFLVLARQYPETAPVHADLIRELDEVTREEACKRGIYIVTGRFTEEAKNISRKMAVDLVDGVKLTELIEGPHYDGRWTFRVVDEKGVVTDLSKMPLLNFEREVDLFLKSMGFRLDKIRRVPGGAVVAVADFPHPITGGKFCVLGRQFPAGERVPAELVSEMSHVMRSEFCYRGILLVPADYAMDARALARFSNVELVDRNTWENLRRQI